jgi:RsiW-degrading membrane proteinase PrsW (M82 family)
MPMPEPDLLSIVEEQKQPVHWPSVLQLGFSLLGTVGLWLLALVLGVMVISNAASLTENGGINNSLPLLLMAAGATFAGLMLLPSAGYAYYRLVNKPIPIRFRLQRPGWVILLVPLLIGLGYLASESSSLVWIVLPPIHVITIAISIFWLAYLGTRGIKLGSGQRVWGIFGVGMVAGPFLSIIVEFIVILGVGILGIGFLARDPVFAWDFSQLAEKLFADPNQPPDAIIDFFEPYIFQPFILYLGLSVTAVLVPLIEEFFKPLGVWLLLGRNPSPAQGFAAGILSGAGFALFENFSLAASSGEEWSLVVLTRIGTSVIHIIVTGLTGWALASAWHAGRYIRLGLTYLLSVSIHALWNGLVVLTLIPELLPDGAVYPEMLRNIGTISPIGFAFLLVGAFVLLLGCNLLLRRAIIPPVNSG